MSDHNIKLMLDFFKNQDFQVIFCAPPNKLESIGSECGVIIPVLKNANDDMLIGKVKFHDTVNGSADTPQKDLPVHRLLPVWISESFSPDL